MVDAKRNAGGAGAVATAITGAAGVRRAGGDHRQQPESVSPALRCSLPLNRCGKLAARGTQSNYSAPEFRSRLALATLWDDLAEYVRVCVCVCGQQVYAVVVVVVAVCVVAAAEASPSAVHVARAGIDLF